MPHRRSGYTSRRNRRRTGRRTSSNSSSSTRSRRSSSKNFRSVSSSSARRRNMGNMERYLPSQARNMITVLHQNSEPQPNLLRRHHTA